MVLWRQYLPASFFKWTQADFTFTDCADNNANHGGCVDAVVSANRKENADHFLGLEVLTEAYPGVRIIANFAVVDQINKVYQEKIDKWKKVLGAFGTNLIAWSQNLTPEAAEAASAILVFKDQLFERADILTIHLVLSNRTRDLVGAAELNTMMPTARLINASRGPIRQRAGFDQHAKNKQIAGAAIDVFDIEPLPPSHPFRTLDNVLATPHIGYVSQGLYKTFYEDTVSNIRKWLDTQ
jgi:hypothetical protein